MTMPYTGGDPAGMPPPAPPGVVQPSPVTVNMPPMSVTPPPGMTMEEHEAALEKARREEKDKLYPVVDELKARLHALEQEKEEQERQAVEAAQAAAEEAKRKAEEEMSVTERFEQYVSETERRFKEVEEARALERAMLEKERQLAALAQYRERRILEEAENIAPQLRDLVAGNSTEEIDQSIEMLKAKTESIQTEIQQVLQSQGRPPVNPMVVSGQPTMDQTDLFGQREVSLKPEDIASMSPEEYARLRPQLRAAAADRVRSQGLYAP